MSFAESTNSQQEILLQLEDVSPWNQEPAGQDVTDHCRLISEKVRNRVTSSSSTSNNSKTLVSTPLRKTSKDSLNGSMVMDNLNDTQEIDNQNNFTLTKNGQFDAIASNVNLTIEELNKIYSQIGYSSTEISIKKSQIFQVIDDTISSFADNLRREQTIIENECEWLRQQIRVILAMINDANGDKYLKLISRGVVFNNKELFEQGYKQEILEKLTNLKNRKSRFYASSPFNDASISTDSEHEISLQNQYEHMLHNVPELSLLQSKGRLNSIFLEVIKNFIRSFKIFNSLNLEYLDTIDSIGQFYSSNANVNILKALPSKVEAENHQSLIESFESVIKELKLNDSGNVILTLASSKTADDHYAFIISSPRKLKQNGPINYDDHQVHDIPNSKSNQDTERLMDSLRDLNHQIVHVIRSLKITKLTPEFITNLQNEIKYCKDEADQRKLQMSNIITECLSLINTLHMTDDQLVNTQKLFDGSDQSNTLPNDGYFDSETLKFIQKEPREFGLMDQHFEFVNKLASTLSKIKTTKQKKWDYYLDSCSKIWDKLGENRDQVENFLNANSSLTDLSLMNFKVELNRLLAKRSEFIENFISDAKIEIEALWSKMFYSDEDKRSFKYFDYDINDDFLDKELVLSEHEQELRELKKSYELKEPILSLYSQILELFEDQKFLQESSKDSSRLLSKNSCKILLNEEKLRKKINKNMPKLISEIKTEIVKFNRRASEQKPISINGEDFLEKIMSIESQLVNEKGNRSRISRSTSQQVSPRKVITSTLRSSPIRRPPVNHKPVTMNSRSKGGISPKNLRSNHPSILSPTKNSHINNNRIAKPRAKTSIKAKHNTAPSSRLESPIRPVARSNSNISRIVGTQLQPLNTPLLSFNENKSPKEGLEFNTDSTIHSNISRFSPLKINDNPDLYSNAQKIDFSPVKNFEEHDKENKRSSFSLSPIKILSLQNEKGDIEPETNPGNQVETFTADSSTIIADDYQAWRDEKIRQLNGIRN